MSTATYAPAYRQPVKQQSIFHKQLKVDRKRSQHSHASGESESSGSETQEAPVSASVQHPVKSTDPFYVAGWPREQPLPPLPFPYAAVRVRNKRGLRVDDELTRLKPPIYITSRHSGEQTSSLKRRHLDNLTAILQTRILKHDWPRASRTLGLILRTEVVTPVDIRRHDRWTLAGEILLQRDSWTEQREDVMIPGISEHGCKSARDFYEKMILHFPYYQRLHNKVNAAAIYPALFNVWIYEVSDRSRQAVKVLHMQESPVDGLELQEYHASDGVAYCRIKHREVEEASEIASRIDQLIIMPPYDTDRSMIRLRAMVGQWIADMCKSILAQAETLAISNDGPSGQQGSKELFDELVLSHLQQKAASEEENSRKLRASNARA